MQNLNRNQRSLNHCLQKTKVVVLPSPKTSDATSSKPQPSGVSVPAVAIKENKPSLPPSETIISPKTPSKKEERSERREKKDRSKRSNSTIKKSGDSARGSEEVSSPKSPKKGEEKKDSPAAEPKAVEVIDREMNEIERKKLEKLKELEEAKRKLEERRRARAKKERRRRLLKKKK